MASTWVCCPRLAQHCLHRPSEASQALGICFPAARDSALWCLGRTTDSDSKCPRSVLRAPRPQGLWKRWAHPVPKESCDVLEVVKGCFLCKSIFPEYKKHLCPPSHFPRASFQNKPGDYLYEMLFYHK